MNEELLPICKNPPITTYHHHAFPLGVLFADSIDIRPWFYSNYIQLVYDTNDKCAFNFMYTFFSQSDLFEVLLTSKQIINKFHIDLTDYIKNAIQTGYYLYAYTNEYYIPRRMAYQKYNNDHDICIFGYNDDEFYTLGYNKDKNYVDDVVKFDDFKKSDPTLIFLFKLKKTNNYVLNLSQIYDLLNDYVFPSKKSSLYGVWMPNCHAKYWGGNAYKYFEDYFQTLGNHQTNIDLRGFQLLLEHKQCMYERLIFLKEHCALQLNNQIDSFKAIVDLAQQLKFQFIKYSMKGETSMLPPILKSICSLREKESVILIEVLNIIKRKID